MHDTNEAIRALFGKAAEELGPTERHVLRRAKAKQVVSVDTNVAFNNTQTFGGRLADSIARIGGSWGFIIAFLCFLIGWCALNAVLLTRDAFDPYPFIFLNLVLSMVAALQAPIIMMSQNRQTERDRLAASQDYEVNLKSEVELISLHHKVDDVLLREIADLKADIRALHDKLDAAQSRS